MGEEKKPEAAPAPAGAPTAAPAAPEAEERKAGPLDRIICFICIPWLILGAIALPSTVEKNRITVLIAMIAIPAALGTVFGIRLVRTKGLGSRLAGGCALVFFGGLTLLMVISGLLQLLHLLG